MTATTSAESEARLKGSARRAERAGWALGALFVLSGVGVAGYPALWFGSARTEGTVTKLEPQVELISHGSPQAGDIVWFEEVMVWYPVVQYEVGEQRYTYRPRSTFRTYRIGDKLPLLYKADRPGVASVDTFADRWLTPLLGGGVLLVWGALLIAGAAFFKRIRRQLEARLAEVRRSAEGHVGQAPTTSNPAERGAAPDRSRD